MDLVDNRNVSTGHLTGSHLHLSRHEKGNLAMNLIKRNYENYLSEMSNINMIP